MASLNSLFIEKFRGIKSLKIEDLKRINLIVGDNNCGKTSVLEAIQLLRTSGSFYNAYKIARQRDALFFYSSSTSFDNFISMFPKTNDGNCEIKIFGKSNENDIAFQLAGRQERILVDKRDLYTARLILERLPEGDIETEAFEGYISLKYGKKEKRERISLNRFSRISRLPASSKDEFSIVYVSPFEHLQGNIINRIIRNESYKQICLKALQLFDSDIEDMLIFKSERGNRPVEYLRHKQLGDMQISSYGDGIKRALALSNAIAGASNGILLIDEIETEIHKKYYDDSFRFIVKACNSFNVQAFITTHSIEAIDGLLATQDYEDQSTIDDISVCTIKKTKEGSFTRVLAGREVYENREAFGFEVRL